MLHSALQPSSTLLSWCCRCSCWCSLWLLGWMIGLARGRVLLRLAHVVADWCCAKYMIWKYLFYNSLSFLFVHYCQCSQPGLLCCLYFCQSSSLCCSLLALLNEQKSVVFLTQLLFTFAVCFANTLEWIKLFMDLAVWQYCELACWQKK